MTGKCLPAFRGFPVLHVSQQKNNIQLLYKPCHLLSKIKCVQLLNILWNVARVSLGRQNSDPSILPLYWKLPQDWSYAPSSSYSLTRLKLLHLSGNQIPSATFSQCFSSSLNASYDFKKGSNQNGTCSVVRWTKLLDVLPLKLMSYHWLNGPYWCNEPPKSTIKSTTPAWPIFKSKRHWLTTEQVHIHHLELTAPFMKSSLIFFTFYNKHYCDNF